MRSQEFYGATPRIAGSAGVVNLWTRIVEERVIGAGVNVHLDLLAEILELSFQLPRQCRRYKAIALRIQPEHRRFKIRQVRLDVGMSTIKHHARTNVWILRRRVQRQRATHTESNYADLFTRNSVVSRKIFSSRGQISFSLVDTQGHHQLPRFVRRLRRLAVIQIRRERDKTFTRKPVANVFDVIHETPPLLNHNHTWTTATLRNRE